MLQVIIRNSKTGQKLALFEYDSLDPALAISHMMRESLVRIQGLDVEITVKWAEPDRVA